MGDIPHEVTNSWKPDLFFLKVSLSYSLQQQNMKKYAWHDVIESHIKSEVRE